MGKTTYQESIRRRRNRVEVHSPVHESLTASNGENDRVHIINRHGLDHHCLRPQPPVRINVSFSFGAGGACVDPLGELSRETQKRVCRHVQLQRWQVRRKSSVSVQVRFGKVVCTGQSCRDGVVRISGQVSCAYSPTTPDERLRILVDDCLYVRLYPRLLPKLP